MGIFETFALDMSGQVLVDNLLALLHQASSGALLQG